MILATEPRIGSVLLYATMDWRDLARPSSRINSLHSVDLLEHFNLTTFQRPTFQNIKGKSREGLGNVASLSRISYLHSEEALWDSASEISATQNYLSPGFI